MIKNVMLIDDNKIDLFVNQRIIEKYNPEIDIKTFNNAISAISFFKLLELNINMKPLTVPDVVLLDINMPEMNGFNFFKEFNRLNLIDKSKIDIYMLSSSLCPDDIYRARMETHCSGYITKPLTVSKLENVFNKSVNNVEYEKFKKII
ncbi:response regulator [Xanthomarina gelatinilytica]|nr:response regulator [Xanthomarina gelatinilytica]